MIPMFKAPTFETLEGTHLDAVMSSGMLGEGPVVAQFTLKLEEYFEHRHVIPTNSCTSAMMMALRSCIGWGYKGMSVNVLTSPFSMMATANAVCAVGAKPVFCDVDPTTMCMDLMMAMRIIKEREYNQFDRIHAVMVTLVGGLLPHAYDQFYAFCLNRGVTVIIDAAHAFGTRATYGKTLDDAAGSHVSHIGDYVCFSFQSIKHLTCGDGGAVTVNTAHRDDVAESLRDMKWFGMSRIVPDGMTRLEHQMTADIKQPGYKAHMNDVSAAIGLDCWDGAMAAIGESKQGGVYYNMRFADCSRINTMAVVAGTDPSYWLYGILVRDRDGLMKVLAEDDIQSTTMWRRSDEYTAFNDGTANNLVGMDWIQKRALFIPNGWWMRGLDRERVADIVMEFCCND